MIDERRLRNVGNAEPRRRREALRLVPRFMRPAVAAEYLGVSASHLRKLAIPRRRMSGAIVGYLRDDLDAFLDELPFDGERSEAEEVERCNAIFGLSE